MDRLVIDFDEMDDWARSLSGSLSELIPDSLVPTLVEAAPEFIEDALDILFTVTDRDAAIAGYHGTRLTEDEVDSVRTTGLLPLKAEARRERLARALGSHPNWMDASGKLDETIADYGTKERGGRRERQVHLTLSRAGLMNGFNHYLTHGAEFDQHVAYALLGPEGEDCLRRDGRARVIKIMVLGADALEAAHPFFSIDDVRASGDLPNLVNEFLKAWAYRQAYPEFQSHTLQVDCGMIFYRAVPGSWIAEIETLEDGDTTDRRCR